MSEQNQSIPGNSTPELSDDQLKIIESVYGYSSKAEYTEAEFNMLKEMFDKPEKLAVLRKVLQIFTLDEKGLHMNGDLAKISAQDRESFAIEVMVHNKAENRIKSALVSLYLQLKGSFQEDKKEELEKFNQEQFEESQRTEKFEEEQEEANRPLGVNL